MDIEKDLNRGTGLKIFDHLPLPSGQSVKLQGMLLVVCQAGQISALVDFKKREMGAANVLVLRPGRVIRLARVSHDFQGFFISATDKRLNEMLPSYRLMKYSVQYESTPMIEAKPAEVESLSAMFRLMQVKMQRAADGAPYAQESLRSLCELMFYDTLALYSSHVEKDPQMTRRQEMLNAFMELVEGNYQRHRRIDFYASKLRLTSKHLSTAIKEACGHTAGDLITLRVMSEARFMLRNSCLNIQEIARALNFKTQSFFGKYFKTHAGISPSEFRAAAVTDAEPND